jgi:hypothetical protein
MSMMRSGRFWLGILLLVAGATWLLADLEMITVSDLAIAVAFGAAGVGFAIAALQDRARWWAFIPAGALIGIAAVIGFEELAPSVAEEWGAGAFLASLGIGFLAIFGREPVRWWAIIPGGVLTSLGLMVAATATLAEMPAIAVLFAGMALTFAGVGQVRTDGGRMRWPYIPAAIFSVLAVLFAVEATRALELFNFAWPAAIIVAGLYLVWRNGVRGSQRHS